MGLDCKSRPMVRHGTSAGSEIQTNGTTRTYARSDPMGWTSGVTTNIRWVGIKE